MKYSDHGDRNSDHGWEIDHIKPASDGGSDDLINLRPLQWENNATRQSGRLVHRHVDFASRFEANSSCSWRGAGRSLEKVRYRFDG